MPDPLNEIHRTLGRLESKVDQALEYGDRIKDLETWRGSIDQKIAWVAGSFAAVATLITLVIQYVWDRVTQGHN